MQWNQALVWGPVATKELECVHKTPSPEVIGLVVRIHVVLATWLSACLLQ
jgi:hypothetical protein